MKYSTILATTFAATAFARALPQGDDPTNEELVATGAENLETIASSETTHQSSSSGGQQSSSSSTSSSGGTHHSSSSGGNHHSSSKKEEEKYPPKHEEKYDDGKHRDNKDYDDGKHRDNNDYDDGKHRGGNDYDDGKHRGGNDYDDGKHRGGNDYDDGKSHDKDYDDNKYDYEAPEYKKEVTKYDQVYFKPVEKQCYEDKKQTPGYKTYKPEPEHYNVEKSYYGGFKWPSNLHKQKSCEIEWKPKKYSGKWEKKYNTKIYLYDCDDYSKPKYTVCDKNCGEGKYTWTIPDDCETSDSDKPKFYRFKFVREDDEEECTWGEETPIYKKTYVIKPAKPEECPEPIPVPECPPVPVAPVKSVDSKPSGETPVYGSSPIANASSADQPPAYTGAGSVARASLSVIVGVAALVTFAL